MKIKFANKISLLILLLGVSMNIAVADSFVNSLRNCTPYNGTFIHPFFGQQMSRQILSSPGNVCKYREQMPNNMQMECNYPKSVLPSVAQYYADVQTAKSSGTKVSTGNGPKYFINGKQVSNPVQEATDCGICTFK